MSGCGCAALPQGILWSHVRRITLIETSYTTDSSATGKRITKITNMLYNYAYGVQVSRIL